MEFKSLKNIESSFRQIRLFGIVFLSLCTVVTVWSVWNSYRFAEKQREKIYVLDNGKSLMLALSQDLSQNRPAEAREHVRRFHELFFTLSPEKSAIEHNVKRALLLADKSVYHYYSDFAEKGYYNRIIAGNINQVLKVDSVVCDFNAYPYRAVTYATQKIIRQSNVTERSLVTTCRLLNASRSDDNPNGFTIEGFTIIENKDLQTIILSDHGYNIEGEAVKVAQKNENETGRQHPILFVKGLNESHDLQVSGAPISYEDLVEAYYKLMDGAASDDCFAYKEGDQRERRYLLYKYLGEDHMVEYVQTGYAGDESTLVPTGRVFDAK